MGVKVEFKSEKKMECLEFFKIQIDGKWCYLEEYFEYCENNGFNFEEKFTELKIKYKDKEYTWEEYNNDLRDTSTRFRPDEFDDKYIRNSDFIYLYNPILYRTIMFFSQVQYNISAAYEYANKSYEKIQLPLYRKKSYPEHFYRRSWDFGTAVMWYGTCFDYLVQAFCSRFDLYKELTNEDTSEMDFFELVKLCEFKKIEEISVNHKQDREFNVWIKNIRRCRQNISKLQDIYNTLKHRGGLKIKNFDIGTCIDIVIEKKSKKEFFKVKTIDIDEDFELLVEAHNNIVSCYGVLLNRINKQIDVEKENFEKLNPHMKFF